MCTGIRFGIRFFGRTLDWMESYGEVLVVAPRNYKFEFKFEEGLESHFAIMGMAVVSDNYPLFYEGFNEAGLGMAGLYFKDETVYHKRCEGKINVAPFEIVPYILGQCKSVREARERLDKMNIVDEGFNDRWGTSPLHWILADKKECIVIESLEDGLKVYENSYGVLTNAPSFDSQVANYNNYMNLHHKLPGNWTSMSRFVRAVYVRNNSKVRTRINNYLKSDDITFEDTILKMNEMEMVNHYFRMLDSVSQIRGCNKEVDREDEITIYSCCQDLDKGIYYYTTYECRDIKSLCFDEVELNGDKLYIRDIRRM